MADVKVTAEVRYVEDTEQWEASAYGGSDITSPINLQVSRDTREQAEQDFITEWNQRDGTSWSAEQFQFVTWQDGRAAQE